MCFCSWILLPAGLDQRIGYRVPRGRVLHGWYCGAAHMYSCRGGVLHLNCRKCPVYRGVVLYWWRCCTDSMYRGVLLSSGCDDGARRWDGRDLHRGVLLWCGCVCSDRLHLRGGQLLSRGIKFYGWHHLSHGLVLYGWCYGASGL